MTIKVGHWAAGLGMLLALAGMSSRVGAQTDPVVMQVGGEQIKQSELMKSFMGSVGNRLLADSTATEAEKRTALHEYADLYANFRAKLLDAHQRGLDTTPRLVKEFRQYRAELAAPYLIDSATLKRILAEAYERNHYSLHAAHLLFRLPPDASPEDTAKAYARALRYRDRVVGGEDFYSVAIDLVYGGDTLLEQNINPNEGDLGYFTAFDMVYPFENAVYNMKVGELSMPVRTKFGYHVIWLIDKVALFGKMDIAHIWFQCGNSEVCRFRAEDCYKRLQSGVSFAMAARQSDDKVTAEKGGVLKDARLNVLPPEYLHALDTLKPGEYSRPFPSTLGWHIVKLIRRDTLPPIEEIEAYYKQKLSRDPRGLESRKEFARQAALKYGFVDLTKPQLIPAKSKKGKPTWKEAEATLEGLYAIVPEKAMRNKWRYHDSLVTDIQPILQTPNKVYTTLDLARYIAKHQKAERPLKPEYFVNLQYQNFIDSVAISYADSMLESEHPDFAELVEEYWKGLNIFNYNSHMVWVEAMTDTVGYTEFYRQESAKKRLDVAEDSIYFWGERARVVVIEVSDSNCLPVAKAEKIIRKASQKGKGHKELKAMLESGRRKKCDSEVGVSINLVERRRQQLLKESQWAEGVYFTRVGKGYRAVLVEKLLQPMLKSQTEARGYYMSAYQAELERQLCETLRQQYDVKIDWNAIGQIHF
ncbi:MAG: peptidylprolyl isomerase [Bacteroidales bacterium]|nr:peptidylprolyl isomerase [Bacteroidales bacterium]